MTSKTSMKDAILSFPWRKSSKKVLRDVVDEIGMPAAEELIEEAAETAPPDIQDSSGKE